MMRKLRKSAPERPEPLLLTQAGTTSATLRMALATTRHSSSTPALHAQGNTQSIKAATATEQYWAARALTAETLLSARMAHQREVENVTAEHEFRKAVGAFLYTYLRTGFLKADIQGEIERLRTIHETKERRLEKIVVSADTLNEHIVY